MYMIYFLYVKVTRHCVVPGNQARADRINRQCPRHDTPAARGIFRQHGESLVQPADLNVLLPVPPTLGGVDRDADQIGVRLLDEVVPGHLFATRPRSSEDTSHARILRPAAGDTLLDGCAQRLHLRLVLLLLAFKQPQPGANHFAGRAERSGLDLRAHELLEVVSERNAQPPRMATGDRVAATGYFVLCVFRMPGAHHRIRARVVGLGLQVVLSCFVVPAASPAATECGGAQQYWENFRTAALKGRPVEVAGLTSFPFAVRKTLDDTPTQQYGRADFLKAWPRLLRSDPGVAATPTTMKSLIRSNTQLSSKQCSDGDHQFRVGNWVFQLKPAGWRFVQAFLDD